MVHCHGLPCIGSVGLLGYLGNWDLLGNIAVDVPWGAAHSWHRWTMGSGALASIGATWEQRQQCTAWTRIQSLPMFGRVGPGRAMALCTIPHVGMSMWFWAHRHREPKAYRGWHGCGGDWVGIPGQLTTLSLSLHILSLTSDPGWFARLFSTVCPGDDLGLSHHAK